MFNKKVLFLFLLGAFVALTAITYFKTRGFEIKGDLFEEFQEFYIQREFESGILLEPIMEGEATESENSIEYTVAFGDTLESIFSSFEFSESDYRKVINLIDQNLRRMKIYAGQKLQITYKTTTKYIPFEREEDEFMPSLEAKNQTNFFKSINFKTQEQFIEVKKLDDDVFEIKLIPFQKVARPTFKKVEIKNSLYQDGLDAGISPNVLENLTRLYSFDVDFQRDIREGDTFEVYYEEIYDDKTGVKLLDGQVLYSKITLAKNNFKPFEYYLFKGEYYDASGKASAKSFLKTPVPAARISSRFGLRRHPILGFTRLHAGVDFAAPRGAPIFAAASGTIEFIGWNGGPRTGYGRLIIIRHNETYKTLYAHQNGFRKGLTKGSKIKQGEVIGYVGSTGYATGPHLHYEVAKNGKKINPSTVTSFATRSIPKNQMADFTALKQKINVKINEAEK